MDLKLKNKVILVSGDELALAAAISRLLGDEGALSILVTASGSTSLKETVDRTIRRYSRIDGLVTTGPDSAYLGQLCLPWLKKTNGSIVSIGVVAAIPQAGEGIRCRQFLPECIGNNESVAATAAFLLSPLSGRYVPNGQPCRAVGAAVISPGHEPPG